MLEAFTAGLLLITVSELGDKTFFIGAILATRYPRRWVFLGSAAALAAMTVLSVLLGQVIGLLPMVYVKLAECLLFLVFGLKLLYQANRMKGNACMLDEQQEAAEAIHNAEKTLPTRRTPLMIVAEAFGLTFVGEWGDRTQFATIALAAANNPLGVVLGATLGHAICTAIAVVGGRMICQYLSERVLTLLGGGLFLVFAAIAGVSLVGVV
ncbi:MAG: TMEM165/GDT1 family protein [Kaiparowitsia implicata GSE-PSE-MK54-09C]|jgi:putative Ca2+/H+ antiporter (TMEM165/GDT1 family)|nr:TMEM165/GDT1 family protein [Kaiparowitsia implicata GSE-PSE-MK54-09C]